MPGLKSRNIVKLEKHDKTHEKTVGQDFHSFQFNIKAS
jgi:hypothetical protein